MFVLLLAGCPPPDPSPIHPPYLRVEDNFGGHKFIGAFFTPGGDVELSVYNAPEPCGQSACTSGKWQSVGVVKAGPVGGQYPFSEGQFQVVISKQELDQRRRVGAYCYPGADWYTIYVLYTAKDLKTGKVALGSASSLAYFKDARPCA
jgi:hypothetical protein